jgi:hypothetical protein
MEIGRKKRDQGRKEGRDYNRAWVIWGVIDRHFSWLW